MDIIDEFILSLTEEKVTSLKNTVNPYFGGHKYPQIRRENLRLYLKSMHSAKTETLLIGEAPGYRGCGQTGIPFTSEDIMLRNNRKHNMFGISKGYKQASDNKSPMKEATATIVWETVTDLEELPLMWNAFPFHPHKPGNVESNRKPTVVELEIGAKYVSELIRIFEIKNVVTVGTQAEAAINRFLGAEVTNFQAIRHPSYGGKNDFVNGMKMCMA